MTINLITAFNVIELRIEDTNEIKTDEGEISYVKHLEIIDKDHNLIDISLHLENKELDIIA